MKMTQNEIAEAVGYSQAHISRVLSGAMPPSVTLAKRLEPLLKKPWQSWFEDPRVDAIRQSSEADQCLPHI